MENRRRTVDRIDDMSAKDTTAHGRTIISGLGQILIDLVFPVSFSNKPIFTYGADLDDQPPQTLLDGRYPKLNATVVEWTTIRKATGAFDGYYIGCKVALFVEGGSSLQKIGFNWAFREIAVRNPITGE